MGEYASGCLGENNNEEQWLSIGTASFKEKWSCDGVSLALRSSDNAIILTGCVVQGKETTPHGREKTMKWVRGVAY